MDKKEIPFFAPFCLLLGAVCSIPAAAIDKTLEFGGEAGWPALSYQNGVVFGQGRFGYDALELKTNSRSVTPYTDLLLPFDGLAAADETGQYTVTADTFVPSETKKMGSGAALSSGVSEGMVLSGRQGTIFGAGGYTGSFTIEFWLCPSIAENGETVLSWRSSREDDSGYIQYQMLLVSFVNNHTEWRFTNLFSGYTQNGGDIVLSSTRTIIPEEWTHHSVSFDAETGLLEYRIDGMLETIRYITDTGRQRGSVYPFMTGLGAEIVLCPQYSGSIDDFRILRSAISGEDQSAYAGPGYYDVYRVSGGRFETQPVKVAAGSVINRVSSVITEPEQTAVQLYVRAGDNVFAWTDTQPAWQPVSDEGTMTQSVSGSYVQVAAELYPDGACKVSPSVTSVTLHYTEIPAPLPPFSVYAEAGDGYVDLHWSPSADSYAEGYMVYYGERPGEYLGKTAVQGSSPIDAGEKTTLRLTGLQNGKIYYFAVASYSRAGAPEGIGSFSKEVYVRPVDE